MSRTVLVVVVVAALLVGAVGLAWWYGPARHDRVRELARQAAEREAPGALRVLSVRGLGAAGGYEVTAAVVGDPDAVASFATGPGGACPPGSRCALSVGPAVARARAEAAELRSLTTALDGCGVDVAGIRELRRIDRPGGTGPGIDDAAGLVAELTVVAGPSTATDGGAALLALLDRCAVEAARARTGLAGIDPDGPVTLSVRVLDPADAVRPGPPGPDRPRALVLREAAEAASARVRHRTTVRATRHGVHEGATLGFGPAGETGYRAAAERAAAAHLRATGVPAADTPALHAFRQYLPGSTDRVRAYVSFRSPGRTSPGDDRVVAVDVGTDGSDPVALRVLDAPQPWRLPFEPGLR
ncbi:hypothetical protein [Pseudonocardia alni]|uniref:hypothetical protein n=1 Tax=Pseudonocardia alni TaxID=33907 RepID=UPI0012FD36F1|nr:hypothetical protein [Pseudonocardia alni]